MTAGNCPHLYLAAAIVIGIATAKLNTGRYYSLLQLNKCFVSSSFEALHAQLASRLLCLNVTAYIRTAVQ